MAAKTYQDLITEARRLLQDTEDNRWSDDLLVGHLNQGLQVLSTIRPDAFYDLYSANSLEVPRVVTGTAGTDEVALTSDFNLEMQFFTPLVHFVVGSTELVEDEYTVDGRAAAMINLFRGMLTGQYIRGAS